MAFCGSEFDCRSCGYFTRGIEGGRGWEWGLGRREGMKMTQFSMSLIAAYIMSASGLTTKIFLVCKKGPRETDVFAPQAVAS